MTAVLELRAAAAAAAAAATGLKLSKVGDHHAIPIPPVKYTDIQIERRKFINYR